MSTEQGFESICGRAEFWQSKV